jgi:hypothetical protein
LDDDVASLGNSILDFLIRFNKARTCVGGVGSVTQLSTNPPHIRLRPLFTSASSAIKMARGSMPVLRAFVSSCLKGWRSSRGGAETRSNLGRSTSPRHFFTTEAPSRSHSSALGPIPRHF